MLITFGISIGEAGGIVGVVFGMSLVGKLVWGALAERLNHRYLFSFDLLLMGAGTLMLSNMKLEFL